MQITIINDCCDQNAKLRQISRVGSLFSSSSVNCFCAKSEIEAAGLLVDAIDSFEGRQGIIIVNIAPRNGRAKKWHNGTPFGFFRYKETLILASLDGYVLSLAKKLNLLEDVYIFDIEEVVKSIDKQELNEAETNRIINTQFRSFNFLPRAAFWLSHNIDIPYKKYELSSIDNLGQKVWFVDNFGNIKTTYLLEELSDKEDKQYEVAFGQTKIKMNLYKHLKDLPDDEIGLVVGSSGIENKRFIEIIVQGKSASVELAVKCDDQILIS
ncbi:hypothetical protein K0B03_03765 [Patescibacteria group bacterium]|nr:hypothetical protein [Patescibacteria group bacterium]